MLQSPSSSSVVTQPQQQQQQTFLMQQPQQQQLQEKQQPFDFSQMMAKFKQQTPATTTNAPLKTGQFMMSPASNSRIMDGSVSSFNSNSNNNMMMNTMNSDIMKKKTATAASHQQKFHEYAATTTICHSNRKHEHTVREPGVWHHFVSSGQHVAVHHLLQQRRVHN